MRADYKPERDAAPYRGLSYWHDTVVDDLSPRPALPGDRDVDVAIIGGGLTGLWTAWYLLEQNPGLRIAVLEKEIAGFGASGRNGGWCSALFPRSVASLERAHGRDAAVRMRRAMVETVDEVGRAAASAGIAIDYAKGGTIAFARSGVQLAAARAEVAEAAHYGVDLLESWDADRVRAAGALGATFDPACASVHPAKLVRGLARALERRGVTIFEQTEVLDYAPRAVTTVHGTVRCENVVVATEGYGARLRATKRRVLPLYSLMIATKPLPDATWRELGIEHGQTFTDYRHLLVYGQRTADNRFAFGGRGARYHWGSAIRPEYDRSPRVFAHLERALENLFPSLTGQLEPEYAWGGPLGVPRDWHATASFDAATGVAWAGGYVGDGLSTTNLAGRTLADLITRTDSDLVRLPWVNHSSPSWEPEPLRFIGANAGLLAMTVADAEERVTGRPSLAARIMAPLLGH
ncbi:MAG: FAD-dependent oxidoreductase [Rhodoglobus sp.]|nr:FAD-dependent oxidoreductase [Rhodoglobus sp.]